MKLTKDEIKISSDINIRNPDKYRKELKNEIEISSNAYNIAHSNLINSIKKITDVSFMEKLFLIISKAPILIDIIYNVLILRDLIMNKDKTTTYSSIVSGILVVLFAILKIFNLDIPIETQTVITHTILIFIGLIITIIGFFTAKKTDETRKVVK